MPSTELVVQKAVRRPHSVSMWDSIYAVVVFPLVPVTACSRKRRAG